VDPTDVVEEGVFTVACGTVKKLQAEARRKLRFAELSTFKFFV
jgi:hypothetical protein